jgi:hypothetical protein
MKKNTQPDINLKKSNSDITSTYTQSFKVSRHNHVDYRDELILHHHIEEKINAQKGKNIHIHHNRAKSNNGLTMEAISKINCSGRI